MTAIEIGKTYEVVCPFVRMVYSDMDEEGCSNVLSWKPGIEYRDVYPDSSEAIAHGVGKVFYTVVSTHKPPHPYPERVFFTRKFETPDGRKFGKVKLHILTMEAFRRRVAGYKPGGVDEWDTITLVNLTPEEEAEMLK